MTGIDSIIQKYLQGKTSEDENQQLHNWMNQSSENKKRLFAEKDIWDTYGYQLNLKKYDSNPELELLKKRLPVETTSKTISLNNLLKIAAVLVITFGLGWSTQFISFIRNRSTAKVAMQEIFVPKGQVNQVFLADGTRIWMNSESKLIAPSIFGQNERVVKLTGEAFFEVAKDKKRPFRVEVDGQQIEVLGTSFNVRAYANSSEIETTLESGQIRLLTGNQTTLLNPGEQSVFNITEKQLVVSKVDPVSFSSWKYGRFEFQNEDLIDVFKVVERWYDVEIAYDEMTFKGMHFSGVIKRNKDAKHFLELLNLTFPISYEIKADKIVITSKVD